MNENRLERLCAWLGVASVVTGLVGIFVGFAAGRPGVTIASSPAAIAQAVAHPLAPVGWVGAYLELLSTGMFLAFAVWVCVRLGGGALGAFGQASAGAATALSVASLAVLDVVEYEEGHGLGLAAATVLTKLNSALYISSWFATSFFLLAAGPLMLGAGHRRLGWSGIAAGVAMLVAVVLALVGNAGQLLALTSLVWIAVASIALGRAVPRHHGVAAPTAA